MRVRWAGREPRFVWRFCRDTEAADILAGIRIPDPTLQPLRETAVRLLRGAPAAAPADSPELGLFDWVYLYLGAPERVLAGYETSLLGAGGGQQWAPAYSDIRKTERFKAYVRDSGRLAYWRTHGWPDLCHPTTGDDFACE
jgi:hypothetical protein